MRAHWRKVLEIREAKERMYLAEALQHVGIITLQEKQEVINAAILEVVTTEKQ